MSLVGKWVSIPDNDSKEEDVCYWQDGLITDDTGAGVYLIRGRNVVEGPIHSQLFSISDLAEAVFFETEAEMMAYRKWNTEERTTTILKFQK